MINELAVETQRVIFETELGEIVDFDISLPLQILFDDVISFVSRTDF